MNESARLRASVFVVVLGRHHNSFAISKRISLRLVCPRPTFEGSSTERRWVRASVLKAGLASMHLNLSPRVFKKWVTTANLLVVVFLWDFLQLIGSSCPIDVKRTYSVNVFELGVPPMEVLGKYAQLAHMHEHCCTFRCQVSKGFCSLLPSNQAWPSCKGLTRA